MIFLRNHLIHRGLLTIITILMIISTNCCAKHTIESEELPLALKQTIDIFYKSIENDDIETRISLFSENAIMMPNHWTITKGKDDIGTMLRSGQAYIFKIRDREMIDFESSGKLAYTVNSYYYTWHAKKDTAQWHNTKNVHLWKLNHDGNWKLHLDIWNSNVPLNAFNAE